MKKQLLSVLVIFVITTSFYKTQAQTPMLWGLSVMGGDYSNGDIFEYAAGILFKSQYSFGFVGHDANAPWGSLLYASNKLLYGMSKGGGTANFGALFSYNIYTGKDTVLHSFSSGSDGAGPNGSLIQVNDSMLYGMTTSGGTSLSGTIFSYNINADTEMALYSFAGGTGDGLAPYGSLTEVNNDSMLYGMTLLGGTKDSGTIFSYNIKSQKETLLHSFAGGNQDGGAPWGSLLLVNDSLLYGLTNYGGSAGTGAIIKYNISKGKESVVYSFVVDTFGLYPYSSLIQAKNGLLYGTTVSSGATGNGVVFSYNIATNTEKLVHNFPDLDGGERPYGAVMQASDGNLYGLTSAGGSNNDGVLFSYDIADSTYSVLITFNGFDAWEPYFGNLVEADTSKTTEINKVSINSNQLSVYPNPNNGQFTLKLSDNQIGCTLEIYNLMGEEVYQSVLSNFQNGISLSTQPEGMYFVYLKSGNGVEVAKVMVTK